MSKKILIVGAGNVGKTEMSEILANRGISESDVVFLENTDSVDELMYFRNKEVVKRLESEQVLPHIIFEHSSCYRDEEKQNSQQGWKNRSKYHR